MRKRAVVTIVLSLVSVACGATEPSRPVTAETGKAVSLRIGESAQVVDAKLRFGFEHVASDSRCPKGEQCVWAGDAVVRIWLQRAGGPREVHELHTATNATNAAAARDLDVRLLRLDPSPVAGTAIAARDYVATLAVTAGAAADAER